MPFVRSQGADIYWKDEGKAENTPLVLLNTMSISSEHLSAVARDAYQRVLRRAPTDGELLAWQSASQAGNRRTGALASGRCRRR